MKRRLYPKLILAWICFAVLSFVSVAGITSSLVEKHLIKTGQKACTAKQM